MPIDLSKLTDEQLEAYQSLRSKGPPPTQEAYVTPSPQSIGHGLSEAVSGANPFPGLYQAIRHPIDTAKGLWNAQGSEQAKVPQAFSDLIHSQPGHRLEETANLAQHLIGSVPLVGPPASALIDQIGGTKPEFDRYGNVTKQGTQPDPVGGISRAIGTGIVAPLATEGAGTMARGVARPLAKVAAHLPGWAEAFGADPATEFLEHTHGVRPATFGPSAQQGIDARFPEMESRVASSTTPIELGPPRGIVGNARTTAANEGNLSLHEGLNPINEALERNRVTGVNYGSQISPAEALPLKRGIRSEFGRFQTIDPTSPIPGIARKVAHNLSEQIHAAAPGTAQLDKEIQGLIPITESAQKLQMQPTLGQRVLSRIARPTGGAVPAALGWAAGGPLGAAAGLTAAEAAASPVPMAIAARGFYGLGKALCGPITPRLFQGAALTRKRTGEE